MKYRRLGNSGLKVSPLCLGTMTYGSPQWREWVLDEQASRPFLKKALDAGINFFDTADMYSAGESERVVGRALMDYADREEFVLATKVFMPMGKGANRGGLSRKHIMDAIDGSLQRLGTDYIDLYQLHWPDPLVSMKETAGAMEELYRQGVIKAIGVSNFSPDQMEQFMQHAPLHTCQPPYNLFERDMEKEILPFCIKHDISLVTYGALCRGLLTGKMRKGMVFEGDDLRNVDPKFKEPRYSQYLEAVDKLRTLAETSHDVSLLQFAVRWILDKGVDVALWGARRPDQLVPAEGVFGWNNSDAEMRTVDNILNETVTDPVGPEFMGPPTRNEKSE